MIAKAEERSNIPNGLSCRWVGEFDYLSLVSLFWRIVHYLTSLTSLLILVMYELFVLCFSSLFTTELGECNRRPPPSSARELGAPVIRTP